MGNKIITIILILIFSVSTFTLAQRRGIFVVSVTDSISSEGLPGVSLSYGNQAGISDPEGKVSFNFEGKSVMEARMLGYRSKRMIIGGENPNTVNLRMEAVTFTGNEIIISGTRAEDRTPSAYRNISAKELKKVNLGQDLPILLQEMPGILFTSDAGGGVGYTGISVRGSDATRVNVTLNGIPLNDSESHGLFWVNMPDLASSISDIQVQRGVGTSTNGAAAFGASINIHTHKTITEPYAETNLSGGSFGTLRTNLKFGSGMLPGNFSIEGRISRITSEGFIDRGSSDLYSGMGTLSWYGKKSQLHADVIVGRETTYQSWNGIPESRLAGDQQGMLDYIARNGLDESERRHLLESGSRTYNPFTYENQTDNYGQDHYQLHFSHQWNHRLQWNHSIHYTRGKGYYEEYRKNDFLQNYGIIAYDQTGQVITNGNLTRKRWLDNHFAGTVYNLIYNDSSKTKLIYGGAANTYYGEHFGESLWNSFGVPAGNPYYYNDARKDEFNQYIRAEHEIARGLSLYGDIQYRLIGYRFEGFDQALRPATQKASYGFLNPKAGVSYSRSSIGTVYYSYAVGQREPVRDDFVNSTPESRPNPEKLIDHELGWRTQRRNWSAGLNFYAMEYSNQLVLTGRINDVGAYARTNAGASYRRGLEAEFRYRVLPWLTLSGNTMLSRNRIKRFEYYTDNYDTGEQELSILENTPIALSPEVISFAGITWQPNASAEMAITAKHSGRQYLDNTGTASRSIDPWTVLYWRGSYTWHPGKIKELSIFGMVNNLLDRQWESHGYTYGYIFGGTRTDENFFFPQAGRHFLVGITMRI
jgi:iron complex outermembrane receptor protein